MHDLLSAAGSASSELELMQRLTLGMNHEQQHQELLLTDIKNLFALNPLRPVYHAVPHLHAKAVPLAWMEFSGDMQTVGHAGVGFAFDNETPRHRVYLEPFALASRPVTNGEWLEFMQAGGYSTPELWLSDGWRTVQQSSWQAPLYWERTDEGWGYMTLGGFVTVDPEAPVCHVSYFEADAYARFAGHRLPTEFEWEVAASSLPLEGNFMDSRLLHPSARTNASRQFFGDVWEWTSSAYMPYPGYEPLPVPSANTTASLWSVSWSCAVDPVPHLGRTSVPATVISSIPQIVGNSQDCAWRDDRCRSMRQSC